MPSQNRRLPAKTTNTREVQTSPDAETPSRRNPPEPLLLDLPQVKCLLQMSRSWIYAAMAAGDFPKPVRIGRRAVRWVAEEICAWVKNRPRGGGVE